MSVRLDTDTNDRAIDKASSVLHDRLTAYHWRWGEKARDTILHPGSAPARRYHSNWKPQNLSAPSPSVERRNLFTL